MPPRRSKRLSAEDKDDKGAQGGDDHSPEEKNASSKRKAPHAPSLPRRRSTREKGGSAEAARNALANVNRGPHCPIFQLSYELLKKIWEYLDSKTKMTTTSVCQRWQQLCWQTEELSLKFANLKEPVTAGAMVAVATRFHNLRRIDLMSCYLASAESIQQFCSAKPVFRRMEAINMEAMPELRDRALKALAKCTPNLKELSISKCQRITVSGLKAIADGCPQLTRLNLNYDNLAVPTAAPGVIWPPAGLTKLNAIDLRGCPNLTPDLFENLLQTCQSLEMLVTPCHITDVDLNCIANHCPNLVSLDMSYSYYPTDNGVESVANGCPKLQHFNLEGCQLMTDAAIVALTESPLPLTWLNFSYCLDITDVGVGAVAANCTNLVTLRMVGLYRISEASVFQFIHSAPKLKYLDITQCDKLNQDSSDAFSLSRPSVTIGKIDHQNYPEATFPDVITRRCR